MDAKPVVSFLRGASFKKKKRQSIFVDENVDMPMTPGGIPMTPKITDPKDPNYVMDHPRDTLPPGKLKSFMMFFEKWANASWHNNLMFAAILVASVQSGLESDDKFDGGIVTYVIGKCITYLFGLDVLIKLLATIRWPQWYFYRIKPFEVNAWNIFDFFIAILMFIDINGVKVLRLFRLMRLLKLVKAITTLRLLIAGLIMSMQSIMYIFLMMLLLFFVFAIIGMLLYSCNADGGTLYFGNIGITFVTLFAMSTGGSWTGVMYPMIFNNCGPDLPEYPDCTNIDVLGWLGFVYFSVFVLLSMMVILNLIIGVITQSMEATRKARAEEEEIERQNKEQPGPVIKKITSVLIKLRLMAEEEDENVEELEMQTVNLMIETHIKKLEEVQRTINNIFKRIENLKKNSRTEKLRRKILEYDADDGSAPFATLTLRQKYFRFVRLCDLIAYGNIFSTFTLSMVIVAAALIGIQAAPQNCDAPDGTGFDDNTVLNSLESMVTSVFTVECILKFFAVGPRIQYFFFASTKPVLEIHTWNVVDLIVVVASYLKVSAIAILRLLRLVRLMKLVRALPTLQMLLVGLLKSMSSMSYIFILLMLLFYMFAIMGVLFFSTNDPVHFGNLGLAMITLMQCATLDNWTDVLYINYYGCDTSGIGYGVRCEDPSANPVATIIYFVLFIMLSSMVVLNLVIGVITSSMEEVNVEMRAEKELAVFEKNMAEKGALHAVPKKIKRLNELVELLSFHHRVWNQVDRNLHSKLNIEVVPDEGYPKDAQKRTHNIGSWGGRLQKLKKTRTVLTRTGAGVILQRAMNMLMGTTGITKEGAFVAWRDAAKKKILSAPTPPAEIEEVIEEEGVEDEEKSEESIVAARGAETSVVSPLEIERLWAGGVSPNIFSADTRSDGRFSQNISANTRSDGQFSTQLTDTRSYTPIFPQQIPTPRLSGDYQEMNRSSSTLMTESAPPQIARVPSAGSDALSVHISLQQDPDFAEKVEYYASRDPTSRKKVRKQRKKIDEYAMQQRQAEREMQLLRLRMAKEEDTARYCARMQRQLEEELLVMIRPHGPQSLPPLPNTADEIPESPPSPLRLRDRPRGDPELDDDSSRLPPAHPRSYSMRPRAIRPSNADIQPAAENPLYFFM